MKTLVNGGSVMAMNLRRLWGVLAVAAVLAAGVGCGREGEPAAAGGAAADGDGAVRIAMIPKGTTHEFWKSIHAGANKAAAELAAAGTDVEVIWKGPLKEDDREAQVTVVENFISLGVDGIVLAPLDDKALRGPVRAATAAGIPVVIIDSDLASDDHTSFVATDNYQGGKMAGQHMIELLGGEGRLVMLRYQEGSASTAQREQGFVDAIEAHEGVELISANQYGGATTESAMAASENLLPQLREADGVYTPNESTTFGMLRALQDADLAGQLKFVGFDASQQLVEALEADQIHALVVQNPMKMGYLGIKTMAAHLAGEPVEAYVDTGVTLVTAENMDQPEVAELLDPPLARYLGD